MSHPEQVTNATHAVTLKLSVGGRVGCLGQGNLIERRCPKDEDAAADVANISHWRLDSDICVLRLGASLEAWTMAVL